MGSWSPNHTTIPSSGQGGRVEVVVVVETVVVLTVVVEDGG